MESTQRHMTLIAVLVCFFAVGMAGLLNFFKYRSTSDRIVQERLVVIAGAIETAIQRSLTLGLQFAEIKTLPDTMQRERGNDDLIVSIDLYDTDGQPLYSTDRLRASTPMPASWLKAAHRAGHEDWSVSGDEGTAAGTAIENNFGLTIGYLAMRYSSERQQEAHRAVARELGLAALTIFSMSAALATLALRAVVRRLRRDIDAIELMLRSDQPTRLSVAVAKGPFGGALARFFTSVRGVESQLAGLRGQLLPANDGRPSAVLAPVPVEAADDRRVAAAVRDHTLGASA